LLQSFFNIIFNLFRYIEKGSAVDDVGARLHMFRDFFHTISLGCSPESIHHLLTSGRTPVAIRELVADMLTINTGHMPGTCVLLTREHMKCSSQEMSSLHYGLDVFFLFKAGATAFEAVIRFYSFPSI
jgi:hypothetical protein